MGADLPTATQMGGKVGTRAQAPVAPSPASLTSLTDSHAPASGSSRTRLATDMTAWPSCPQGPVVGSGSHVPRAATLFKKRRTASSAAGPSGAVSFSRTPYRMFRKLAASVRDRSPWASERGSGRSCGAEEPLMAGLAVTRGIPHPCQGLYAWSLPVFLVGRI